MQNHTADLNPTCVAANRCSASWLDDHSIACVTLRPLCVSVGVQQRAVILVVLWGERGEVVW